MLVAIAAMVRMPSTLPTKLMVPVPPLNLCRHLRFGNRARID